MLPFQFQHIPCGAFANESEEVAFKKLSSKLPGHAKEGSWIFLTNIPLSFRTQGYSDEIDILVISPTGVIVIEVKHWDAAFLKGKPLIVEAEADKLNAKVKRVAGKLRRTFDVGFIEGRFLLTKGEQKYNNEGSKKFRGIACFGLSDWKNVLDIDKVGRFDEHMVAAICRELEPKTKINLSGDIRTFGGLINLELITLKGERFHRVYKGTHLTRRDGIILHLFDLSATSEKNAEIKARREFETIQCLQKSPYLPRLSDSFQFSTEYPGELCFYSIIDPSLPSLSEKSCDKQWSVILRLKAASAIIRALDTLHSPEDSENDPPIVHRNLTPENIRVKNNGQPIFTELHVSKLPNNITVSPDAFCTNISVGPYLAPEVMRDGLSVADRHSDIFSICKSLNLIFQNDDPDSLCAMKLLEIGLRDQPEDREPLESIAKRFDKLIKQVETAHNKPAEVIPPPCWMKIVSFTSRTQSTELLISSAPEESGKPSKLSKLIKLVNVNTACMWQKSFLTRTKQNQR